jgi:hypothetical protein
MAFAPPAAVVGGEGGHVPVGAHVQRACRGRQSGKHGARGAHVAAHRHAVARQHAGGVKGAGAADVARDRMSSIRQHQRACGQGQGSADAQGRVFPLAARAVECKIGVCVAQHQVRGRIVDGPVVHDGSVESARARDRFTAPKLQRPINCQGGADREIVTEEIKRTSRDGQNVDSDVRAKDRVERCRAGNNHGVSKTRNVSDIPVAR